MHYLILPHFLSDAECVELMEISKAKGMGPSTGFDVGKGQSLVSDYRTSSNVFLPRQYNLVVQAIENRISIMTGYPWHFGEDLQIVRYRKGQYYKPHHDYHDPAYPGTMSVLARGGQRVITVLMYLNTLEEGEGGATYFPKSKITVMPERGKALLFWNVMPDGRLDESTYHEGQPPRKEKYIATKWLHEQTFY